ncbi:hypothetical protein L3i20_v223140 [Paenibacillus sp. L3-i20]|nr:hypothetical protein L3i20_v223140 [Paenibacillus sp. L3-i20]
MYEQYTVTIPCFPIFNQSTRLLFNLKRMPYICSEIFNIQQHPTILIYKHKALVYHTEDREEIYSVVSALKQK